MGLRTLVKEDLARRKLIWDKKAPMAVPNRKRSARLETRRRAEAAVPKDKVEGRTAPGSYNRKK